MAPARRRCSRCCSASSQPDAGEVRRGANVQIAYYDQQREQLDPERTVWETVADGHDTVTVNDRTQHVHGYLRDFLFPPERALSPVKALSGGERNRLAARAALCPSVQRAGDGRADQRSRHRNVGTARGAAGDVAGHAAAGQPRSRVHRSRRHEHARLRRRRAGPGVRRRIRGLAPAAAQRRSGGSGSTRRRAGSGANAATIATKEPSRAQRKPSYKEQQELEQLPARIEALEAEQQQLQASVASADFYKRPATEIHEALSRLEELETLLLAAYTRWDALDSRT